MPRIPIKEGSRLLTTESPSTLRDAASYGKSGERQRQVGEILARIGEKFGDIMDLHQVTQAQTNAAKRLNDIHVKAREDPDIWNAGKKAQDDITAIGEDLSGTILNNEARTRFKASFDIDALNYTNKINNDLRVRQHNELSTSALEFIDTNTEPFFNASSGVEQLMIKANMKAKVDELVNMGVWEKEKAYKYWKETETELRIGQISHDADIDPQGTLADLQKGKQGLYPDLTEKERRDMVEKVSQRVEKVKKEAQRNIVIARNKGESYMVTQYYNNQLTEGQIDNALKNGIYVDDQLCPISPQFAVSIRRALTSPKTVDAKTDYGTYEKLMSEVLDPNTPASIIRNDILNAHSDEKLSASDLRSLMFVAQRGRKTSVYEDYLRETGKAVTPKKTVWNTIWGWIKNFAVGAPEDSKVIMDRVIERSEKENPSDDDAKTLEITKQEINKKVLEDNPDIAGFDADKGQLMIDAFGNKARVYPDGRTIEEDEE